VEGTDVETFRLRVTNPKINMVGRRCSLVTGSGPGGAGPGDGSTGGGGDAGTGGGGGGGG
jgi:hypothetical protein